MRAFPTKTMAEFFVAASNRWTRRGPEEATLDLYGWCAAGGLLGTGPGQFQPVSGSPDGATQADFANGASVSFVDGSAAVRDLDELHHGRPALWRALAPLPEEVVRRFGTDLL